jgi:hypothetical protein
VRAVANREAYPIAGQKIWPFGGPEAGDPDELEIARGKLQVVELDVTNGGDRRKALEWDKEDRGLARHAARSDPKLLRDAARDPHLARLVRLLLATHLGAERTALDCVSSGTAGSIRAPVPRPQPWRISLIDSSPPLRSSAAARE